MARVRCEEFVVKATDERGVFLHELMREDAEHFLRQRVFLHTVVVIDARLRAPADMQGGMHVRAAPRHDVAELRPVVHFFEVHLLDWRAGDDEAVETLVFDLIERGVERLKVLGRDVRGFVAGGLQQADFNLKRRVRQLAQDLRFGLDFGGHKVQEHESQRTDVLVQRAIFRHDEDVLALKRRSGRQCVGNSDGHGSSCLVVCGEGAARA